MSKSTKTPKWLKKRPRLRLVYELGVEISQGWMKHYNSSMAAAIAYRAMFSMIPLVVLLMMIVRVVQSGLMVVEKTQKWIPKGVGVGTMAELGQMLQGSEEWQQIWSLDGWLLFILAGVMIYGASLVFKELTIAVNIIWETDNGSMAGVAFYRRLWSFLVVLGIGAMIVGVLVVSWGISMIESWLQESIPVLATVSSVLNLLIFPLVLILGFGIGFKYLPRVKLKWRDVWWGSMITTVFFLIGQRVIGIIIQMADYTSYAGTAGTFMVFMMWVYYSAMIFLMGVEITKIYAERWGSLQN